MLEKFSCITKKNELKFITDNTLTETYFPVKKPAEYQAFIRVVRSVSESPICSGSGFLLSFSELME